MLTDEAAPADPAAPPTPMARIEAAIAAGRHSDAQSAAEALVRDRPRDPAAWNALGVVLRVSGHPGTAVAAYTRSLALVPDQVGVLTNLGNAWRDLLRFDKAISCQRAAVDLEPGGAPYWANLGVALRDGARYEEALAAYDKAIEIDPKNARTRVDRGQVLLMLGRYAEGWRDFDWRWKMTELRPPNLSTPAWDGSVQPGATLLLWPEQGFGDTILSVRYLEQARARVSKVILACKPELMRLFQDLPGVDALTPVGKAPVHDIHAPLMALPGIFTPSPDHIPAPARLAGSDASRERLRPRLAAAGKALKVGIVWSGSLTFKGNALRAASLERFLDFAALPGVRLFSLQKGPRAHDLRIAGAAALVEDLAPLLDDFADTAAAIELLDLVVMTDSSVAHLAGSLGRPIWNLLPRMPYWLYGPAAETTPWYPSMRLFRQPAHGDWDSVFAQVTAELRRVAAIKR